MTFLPSATPSWSREDLQALRTLAQSGLTLEAIAKQLRRSASAVRNKATMHGISLASTRRVSPEPQVEASVGCR
jgi:hypothetical protein